MQLYPYQPGTTAVTYTSATFCASTQFTLADRLTVWCYTCQISPSIKEALSFSDQGESYPAHWIFRPLLSWWSEPRFLQKSRGKVLIQLLSFCKWSSKLESGDRLNEMGKGEKAIKRVLCPAVDTWVFPSWGTFWGRAVGFTSSTICGKDGKEIHIFKITLPSIYLIS